MAIEKKARPEQISRGDVEHVAKLARVEITEGEQEKFAHDLDEILNYVKELEEAPTEDAAQRALPGGGVIPVAQISGLDNIARDDQIAESLPNEKVLQNAPEKEGNFIKVKKVFE